MHVVPFRAVLLMTKRDLADLCLEGLLESTEQQQQDQLAALLQVCFSLPVFHITANSSIMQTPEGAMQEQVCRAFVSTRATPLMTGETC